MHKHYTKAIIRASKSRLSKEGTAHVHIYYHHYQTKYFPTGVWVKPKFWLKKYGYISDKSTEGDVDKMNEKIAFTKNQIDSLIKEYKEKHLQLPTGKELERTLVLSRFEQIKTNFNYNFLDEFGNWIREQEFRQAKGSIEIYKQTQKYLEDFICVDVAYCRITYKNYPLNSLEDVDLKFLEAFRDYLTTRISRSTKKSLSNVTINNQIKNIHKFLRNRSRTGEKINANAFNIVFDHKYSPRVFLTESEIAAIQNLNVDAVNEDKITNRRKKTLNVVKDIFIINVFYGLRVKDLFNLAVYQIHFSDAIDADNYILLTTQKTDHSTKLMIIHDHIKTILKKYIGDKDDYQQLFPKMSIFTYNKSLKLLAKYAGITAPIAQDIFTHNKRIENIVPKWKKISSHSVRKTAINRNIIDYGRDVAKYLSTHKSESGFRPYEDLTDYDKIFEKVKNSMIEN